MKSSEKIRALVLAIFLAVLVVFAILYRPTDARSLPTQRNSAGTNVLAISYCGLVLATRRA